MNVADAYPAHGGPVMAADLFAGPGESDPACPVCHVDHQGECPALCTQCWCYHRGECQ